jgi:hypothetical protein
MEMVSSFTSYNLVRMFLFKIITNIWKYSEEQNLIVVKLE